MDELSLEGSTKKRVISLSATASRRWLDDKLMALALRSKVVRIDGGGSTLAPDVYIKSASVNGAKRGCSCPPINWFNAFCTAETSEDVDDPKIL